MKKALIACIAIFSFNASAALIDFESGLDPLFNYTGVMTGASVVAPNSGYDEVGAFTGSASLAFNPNAVSPSTFSWASAGTFDLTSFVIAGAWGSQTLTIEGLFNNNVVNSALFAVDNTQASVFSANWSGLDAFRITTGTDFIQNDTLNGSGQHWALDNVLINENNVAVSTSGSAMLFALGLAGLLVSRRKRA
jgi:hypothetical protein